MKCTGRGTGPLRIDILTLSLITIVVKLEAFIDEPWDGKSFHLPWLHLGYVRQS